VSAEKQYIELFSNSRDLICRGSAPVLNALRDEAFQDFCNLGFPSTKMERYKYTDVSASFMPDYGLNLGRLQIPVNPYNVFHCDVPNLSTSLYFVVNDQFYDAVQPKAALPEGVIVTSLCQAAREFPSLIQKYYGTQARTRKDAINALNTMLAQDGLFVYVPRHIDVGRLIQVVNILRADVDLMVNRRILVVLEEGAQAKLLFCDHAIDERKFLGTQVVEVFVGEGAHLELYELEETHSLNSRFSNMYVRQETNSVTILESVVLQNGLTRNRTDVSLCGEYSEVTLSGGVIADGHQCVDTNTLIDHRAAHCQSRELFKYVLDDYAMGAFAGRILVRENAQKSVSQETNANLCSTRTARMYSQPMLEIYADDVKCNHGSTVGQLNEAALFYMRQRGIPEDEARLLLKFAFMGEVIDGIPMTALRDRLHFLTEKRFRGELGRCGGCQKTINCEK